MTAVDSWWQLFWKELDWNFYVHTKVDTCAKFHLSKLIFIFINCYQLSSAVNSCWQLMTAHIKKFDLDFYIHTKVDTCSKFQLSRLIFIFINCYQLSSAVDSCWQLMTADRKKDLTGNFMYIQKFIPMPNFSSLAWISFSSVVISCWQLLTADDSWYEKNLTGFFMYTLMLILVPNFSSLG